MKNTLRTIYILLNLATMIAFLVFAHLGFCALDRFSIVECLRYSILCLICLFVMLAPVTFASIIPESDDIS